MQFSINSVLSTLGFLVLGVFLLATLSCNDPDTIGMAVQPASDKLPVNVIDTVSVQLQTVVDDSVIAYNYDTHRYTDALLGVTNDSVFGQTRAEFYSQMVQTGGTLPENSTIDSAYVFLQYKKTFGDSSASIKHKVTLFEISSVPDKETYYTSDSLPVGAEIGTALFTIPDSVKGLGRGVKIVLNEYFKNKFQNIKTSDLASVSSLLNFFKGIYFKCEDNSLLTSVLTFDLEGTGTNSGLYVYGHYKKGMDNVNDSLILQSTPGCIKFNRSTHDYQGTSSENELSGDASFHSRGLLKGLGGLKIKLSFPYLNKYPKNTYIINKAELYLPVKEGNKNMPPRLKIEKKKAYSLIKDQSEVNGYVGGYYDAENKRYMFEMSREIQQYFNGKSAENTFNVKVFQSAIVPHFVQIENTVNKKVKLVVTYTKIN